MALDRDIVKLLVSLVPQKHVLVLIQLNPEVVFYAVILSIMVESICSLIK